MRWFKRALACAAIGLILTMAAVTAPAGAAVVTANGICLAASCANSILGATGSSSTSFGRSITVNGDPFQITGMVSSSNSLGLTVSMNPQFTIRYTGSGPVTTTDVINLRLTQEFESLAKVSVGSFFYEVMGHFGGSAGSGTSLAVDNLINSVSVGMVTANPPGIIFGFQDAPNLKAPLLNPLTDTFDYTLTVAAGTLPGFFVEVAEPGSAYLLLGAGLLALGAACSRERRRIR